MSCYYEQKKLCFDVIYTFFYVQMLFFMLLIFFYKLYLVLDKQLIKLTNFVEHKKNFNGVVQDINNKRDKRKWEYKVV